MSRNEAGHTFIELVMSTLVIAVVILLMMPSLSGYQVNAEMRSLSTQVTEQLRNAEELALTQGQILNWHVCWDCAQNLIVFSEPNGTVISQTILPPQIHVTGVCYRGLIYPQGTVTTVASCDVAGNTFEMVCFDSNTPSNPYGWKLTVVVATGEVIATSVGKCN